MSDFSDGKFVISFINGNPGLVVRGNTAEETEANVQAILPVYKKFRDAIEAKRASMQPQTPQPQVTPAQVAPTCPNHNIQMSWKTGVSKKTGRAYAFWACPGKNPDNSFCSYKP